VAAAHLLSSQSRASQSWHPLFLPNQLPPPLICPSQSGAEEWKGTAATRAAPAVADSPFPAREETRSGGGPRPARVAAAPVLSGSRFSSPSRIWVSPSADVTV
jgi:hypothetical protein